MISISLCSIDRKYVQYGRRPTLEVDEHWAFMQAFKFVQNARIVIEYRPNHAKILTNVLAQHGRSCAKCMVILTGFDHMCTVKKALISLVTHIHVTKDILGCFNKAAGQIV